MEIIKGKHILVVGASGGIGIETAKLLSQSGGILYLAGRNLSKINELGQELKVPSERLFEVDFDKAESIEMLAHDIHQLVPQLDILINTAGIGIIKPLEKLSLEDFQRSLNANLTGPFLLFKHFLPPMKAVKQGFIINIPGVLGKTPMAGAAAYSASKYGLNGMLKSIREELRRTQIRITNLYLGGVDSPFWDEIDLRVQKDKFITSKEAARAVWFLCQQPTSGVVSEMVIQPFNHQAI
ncbi:MAG: SDR family oxidoreductase [Bacteroidia bacterium]|nr:SDR family oxidoreductase [Bacteroidia bacterium]